MGWLEYMMYVYTSPGADFPSLRVLPNEELASGTYEVALMFSIPELWSKYGNVGMLYYSFEYTN